jgi:hypothetical protein
MYVVTGVTFWLAWPNYCFMLRYCYRSLLPNIACNPFISSSYLIYNVYL